MKYLLIVPAFFICVQQTMAQQKEDYLQKSKDQKTIAWVLVGAGSATVITGLIIGNSINDNDDLNSGFDKITTGAIVAFAGVIVGAGSIPLFIISSKNKKRAMSMSAGSEKIIMPSFTRTSYAIQSALKISIPLGR